MKMTYNEIIKGLEELHVEQEKYLELLKNTINLINRQKAEIEKLKAEAECADGYAEVVEQNAIKEVAEIIVSDYPEMEYYLEKLIKEMTEHSEVK